MSDKKPCPKQIFITGPGGRSNDAVDDQNIFFIEEYLFRGKFFVNFFFDNFDF